MAMFDIETVVLTVRLTVTKATENGLLGGINGVEVLSANGDADARFYGFADYRGAMVLNFKADGRPAKPAKADAAVGGKQPKGLKAAKKGTADDLQIIEGIGPALEKLLHELGIFHLDQIAQWGAAEIAWIDANLKGFRGRATRDKWVAQAKLIGEVGTEEFLIRAKTNNY
ncbi:MAG: hypothetical protein RL128_1350 [Pseudomonadota bacterium]